MMMPFLRHLLLPTFALMFLTTQSNAFSPQSHNHHNQAVNAPSPTTTLYATSSSTRRSFLSHIATTSIIATTTIIPQSSSATIMDSSMSETSTFKPGETISVADAKKRFKLAMGDVDELIENYAEISKGGGDNVRRYLGTVGVKSRMYGIGKVIKTLRDEADDIVEFTEAANEFEAYLFQAEGASYQSLFVEHSSAKGTPASFLATAKKDVVQMRKFMGDLAAQLNI